MGKVNGHILEVIDDLETRLQKRVDSIEAELAITISKGERIGMELEEAIVQLADIQFISRGMNNE